VKLNLSGQMPQRVDATWASQLAILQGFAGHQTPDLVLREDDLPNALARLADDTDVSAPPYTGTAPTVDLPDDIRAMVRDIYAKDYGAFGFA
jgi:hypothetical protein